MLSARMAASSTSISVASPLKTLSCKSLTDTMELTIAELHSDGRVLPSVNYQLFCVTI